ncbi:MAG: formate dehydrogenase accessory sulfurtransferase FdhD [Bryobacteraceae bacterium]
MGSLQNSLESIVEVPVRKVLGSAIARERDFLAVEEPLEIRIGYHFKERPMAKSISLTMRTPGHDVELAAGFLVGEGIIRDPSEIVEIRHLGPAARNEVQVDLHPSVDIDITRLDRHFYTTSSCGVCGKTSLEAIEAQGAPGIPAEGFAVELSLIHSLPGLAREFQPVFSQTGGLHAAALFDGQGALLSLREDVGRHNALDKLIGRQFLDSHLPLRHHILLVSGRASFELLQKAVMAAIPVVAAIGAPSSLAVELANRANITLLGFVRNNQFNIYSAPWRILS